MTLTPDERRARDRDRKRRWRAAKAADAVKPVKAVLTPDERRARDRDRKRRWRAANSEKRREAKRRENRRYRQAHPEKVLRSWGRWALRNGAQPSPTTLLAIWQEAERRLLEHALS